MRIEPQRYVAALRDWADNGADSPLCARPRRGRGAVDAAAARVLTRRRQLRVGPAPASRRASGRRRPLVPRGAPPAARQLDLQAPGVGVRGSDHAGPERAVRGRLAQRRPRDRRRELLPAGGRVAARPVATRPAARLGTRSPRDQAESCARGRGSCAVRHADVARHDGGAAARDLRAARARARDRGPGGRGARNRSRRHDAAARLARRVGARRQGARPVFPLEERAQVARPRFRRLRRNVHRALLRLLELVGPAGGHRAHRRGHRDPRLPARRSPMGDVHPRPVRAGAHQLPGGGEGPAAALPSHLPAGRGRRPRLVFGRGVPSPCHPARDRGGPAGQCRGGTAHHRRAGHERPRAARRGRHDERRSRRARTTARCASTSSTT